MNGPRWSILIFLACVAAVLAGLASLTFYTLGLERRDYQARADARHQEAQRLVLWRMDSALTPLLTREASRPFFEYEPFVRADLGYGRIPGPIEPGQTIVPSPLLRPQEPLVKLYFTRSRQGVVTSPQSPPAPLREIAESVYMSSYEIELAEQRVRAISELMGLGPSRAPNRSQPPVALGTSGTLSDAESPLHRDGQIETTPGAPPPQIMQQSEVTQSANEYGARKQIADTLSQNRVQQSTPAPESSRRAEKPAASPTPDPSTPPPTTLDAAPVTTESGAALAKREAEANEPQATDSKSKLRGDAKPTKEDTLAAVAEPKTNFSDLPAAAAASIPDIAGNDSAHSRSREAGDSAPQFSNLLALAPMGPAVEVGRLTPRWLTTPKAREPELIFVREVIVEGERMEQGFWTDWPALREMLIANAGDLAPGATLRPLLAGADESNPALLARTLAGIPAELLTGDAPIAQVPVWSPARMTLLMTWIVSLLAIIAIGMVLRAAMELAERRGRFVSAVTHELRTPLTTFCLYSQMLADGLIQGEDARATYLHTLKSESQRLARIVESVLEYARLGRKRPGQVRTLQSVQRLIDQVTPPLVQRCTQAGMTLEVTIEGNPDAADAMVAADAATIERILYNLVDNACKYAASAEDHRVHLVARVDSAGVVFSVRDHGPGIDPAERPRVFRAFVRGTREAAGTIPGLGLGLSLAQGLAREIGAELRLEPAPVGARFDLRLPRA